MFAAPTSSIKVKVLGTEDAPHLIVNLELAEKLDDTELVAAIAHELGHIQNGHILYTTALHYLQHSAAFFVRWVVQPAIMTLQAWSRRAEVTCDRASLLAVRDLDKTLAAMVKLELGLDKGSRVQRRGVPARAARREEGPRPVRRDVPLASVRAQARAGAAAVRRLGALRAGHRRRTRPASRSLADVDKQVAELISVF